MEKRKNSLNSIMIFVGIVTCNRPDFFYNCLKSLKKCDNINYFAVVNDGKEDVEVDKNTIYIKNETNLGVSKSKNKLFKIALSIPEVKHIFILEDDCEIIDQEIFDLYIKAQKETGLHHFNFGPGSPWNRKQHDPSIIGDLSKRQLALQTTDPNPKLIIEYKNDVKIALYEHVVGMLSYFTRDILFEVGLYDENFYNAWEHVEHTYRIILAKKYSPFWWFADILGSEKYIKEGENEKAKTSLAKNEETFMKQVHTGLEHFKKIHNTVPSQIKSVNREEVIITLKDICKNKK